MGPVVSNVDTRSTSSARDGARTLCVVMPPLPDRAGVCMSPPLSMRRLIHLCPVRELKPTLSWGRIWSFCPLLCGGRCDSQKTDGSCVLCEDPPKTTRSIPTFTSLSRSVHPPSPPPTCCQHCHYLSPCFGPAQGPRRVHARSDIQYLVLSPACIGGTRAAQGNC